MTKGPLRGAILANEVGTGKTLTFLMERKVALDERLRALDQLGITERDQHESLAPTMPTMIMAPASVVEQHFNELTRYFGPDVFHIRSFHGSASNTSHNPALQSATINTQELFAEMEIAVHQTKTSQVSKGSGWHQMVPTNSHLLAPIGANSLRLY